MVAPILPPKEFLENRLSYEIQNQNYERAIPLAKQIYIHAHTALLSEAWETRKLKHRLSKENLTIEGQTVINFTIKHYQQRRERHLRKMEDCNNLIKYLRNFT